MCPCSHRDRENLCLRGLVAKGEDVVVGIHTPHVGVVPVDRDVLELAAHLLPTGREVGGAPEDVIAGIHAIHPLAVVRDSQLLQLAINVGPVAIALILNSR